MEIGLLLLAQIGEEAITKDGAISANFALILSISVIGVLITAIALITWNQIKREFASLRFALADTTKLLRTHDDTLGNHDTSIEVLKRDVQHLQRKR